MSANSITKGMNRALRRNDDIVTALCGLGVVMRFMRVCNRDAWPKSVRQRTWSMGQTVTRRPPSFQMPSLIGCVRQKPAGYMSDTVHSW